MEWRECSRRRQWPSLTHSLTHTLICYYVPCTVLVARKTEMNNRRKILFLTELCFSGRKQKNKTKQTNRISGRSECCQGHKNKIMGYKMIKDEGTLADRVMREGHSET